MNKAEALKLIADYGRAVSISCHIANHPTRLNLDKARKNEVKYFRKILKAIGIIEEVTEQEIENA
jgi:hypothetical protein